MHVGTLKRPNDITNTHEACLVFESSLPLISKRYPNGMRILESIFQKISYNGVTGDMRQIFHANFVGTIFFQCSKVVTTHCSDYHK